MRLYGAIVAAILIVCTLACSDSPDVSSTVGDTSEAAQPGSLPADHCELVGEAAAQRNRTVLALAADPQLVRKAAEANAMFYDAIEESAPLDIAEDLASLRDNSQRKAEGDLVRTEDELASLSAAREAVTGWYLTHCDLEIDPLEL